ncbi:hypothetical protein MZM54_01780 [[Brevibacterium] frigoritolerans]|nr:hypothetical protein [Peribacillus frigoritolerans]
MSIDLNQIECVVSQLTNREVFGDLKELRIDVFEKIVKAKAQILSLEEATAAIKFANIEAPSITNKLIELKKELETANQELTGKLERLITEENKENFVKIVKKTKFIKRAPVNHAFFANRNEYFNNSILEITNEELVLLSPYKVAELIRSEKKNPAIEKFVDLYKPEAMETEIEEWINKYAKQMDDAQNIIRHYLELPTVILLEDGVTDIAIRWSVMLGLSGDLENNKETQEAVEEASNIIKKTTKVY